MKKTKLDDDFSSYLTEGACFEGDCGIPVLMDCNNVQIPERLIPFTKINRSTDKRCYVHFYIHDIEFSRILTSTKKYIDILKQYDGVITPDCSMLIGQSKCLQETNTYFNRAIGFYLQKNGIPVIPNIRWSDEASFKFCFLGVPKHSIVAISTHGCIRSKRQKEIFKKGLSEMIKVLEPTDVIVHDFMPLEVFEEFKNMTNFHRYPSEFEQTHSKEI